MDKKITTDDQIDQLLSQQITVGQNFTDAALRRVQANRSEDLDTLDEYLDLFLAKNNAPVDPQFTEKTIKRVQNAHKTIPFPWALLTKITLATAACLAFGLFWNQATFPDNPQTITTQSQAKLENSNFQDERLIALADSLGSEASWLLNEDAQTALVIALAN